LDKFSEKLHDLLRGPIHDLLTGLEEEQTRTKVNAVITELIQLAEGEHNACKETAHKEHNLSTLVESVPNILWIADGEGNITYFNEAWYNFTAAGRLQSKGWGWLNCVDGRDRERVTATWLEHLQDGRSCEIEFRLLAKNDPHAKEAAVSSTSSSGHAGRWFVARALPVKNDNGEVLHWSGTMADIHETRRFKEELSRRVRELQRLNAENEKTQAKLTESENLFRTMCEASPHLIWTADWQGNSDFFNEPWCNYAGKSLKESKASGWLAITHEGDRQRVEAAWLCRVEDGMDFETEARLQRFDGKYRWHLIKGLPIRDDSGRIVKWCCTCTDIEGHRRLVEELIQARDQAQTASRLKSEFVANMSHEIRTPMNGILGMIEILLRTELSAAAREYAQLVQEAGRSLLSIINDILDFSKIEAGRLEISSCEFDLVGLVEGVGEILSPQADAKSLLLSTFVDPKIPPLVIGDPLRLRQILLNLGGNAIKFTSAGSVTVRADLINAQDKLANIQFSVIDTGIGIPESSLERLFEPFVQVDGSISRRYGGTGLGLSISRRLIELLGGQISVESLVGRGSTFSFTLPVGTTVQSKNRDMNQTSQNFLLRSLAIIVDSDKQLRECLANYCNSFGLRTTCCHDLNTAIAAIENIEQDASGTFCIIVDAFRNQELTLDIFERALWGKNNYQLVLLSSKDQREQAENLIPTGNVKVLTRPVRRNALKYYLNITENNRIQFSSQVASPAPPEIASVPELKQAASEPAKLKALVADDNKLNQQVARLLLEALDIQVEVVENGMEAVAAFDGSQFDLVFLDCQMPELDGYAATRIIKRLQEQRAEKTPIIAMTANALEGSREDCLAAGMDDYMAKPIAPGELERVVKAWTSRSSRIKESSEPDVHEISKTAVTPRSNLLEKAVSVGQLREPALVLSGALKEEPPVEEPTIDYTTLLSRFKAANTRQLLTMFADTANQEVASLNAHLEASDYAKLKAAAHAFKGACATICAPRIAASLQKVEEASLMSDNARCRDLLNQVRHGVDKALSEITEHMSEANQ
jgi:PAS domain S-box-containing protein